MSVLGIVVQCCCLRHCFVGEAKQGAPSGALPSPARAHTRAQHSYPEAGV